MISNNKKNSFLTRNKENPDYNQYWFSQKTIEFVHKQIEVEKAKKIAFLSTPSLYFSLENEIVKSNSILFEVFLFYSSSKKTFC